MPAFSFTISGEGSNEEIAAIINAVRTAASCRIDVSFAEMEAEQLSTLAPVLAQTCPGMFDLGLRLNPSSPRPDRAGPIENNRPAAASGVNRPSSGRQPAQIPRSTLTRPSGVSKRGEDRSVSRKGKSFNINAADLAADGPAKAVRHDAPKPDQAAGVTHVLRGDATNIMSTVAELEKSSPTGLLEGIVRTVGHTGGFAAQRAELITPEEMFRELEADSDRASNYGGFNWGATIRGHPPHGQTTESRGSGSGRGSSAGQTNPAGQSSPPTQTTPALQPIRDEYDDEMQHTDGGDLSNATVRRNKGKGRASQG